MYTCTFVKTWLFVFVDCPMSSGEADVLREMETSDSQVLISSHYDRGIFLATFKIFRMFNA